MKILMVGDIVGKPGRKMLRRVLPELQRELELNFVVVNGENAARGFGITAKICKSFYDAGVDVITTGNHVWAQRDIIDYIDCDPRLLRPLNYSSTTPGRGASTHSPLARSRGPSSSRRGTPRISQS